MYDDCSTSLLDSSGWKDAVHGTTQRCEYEHYNNDSRSSKDSIYKAVGERVESSTYCANIEMAAAVLRFFYLLIFKQLYFPTTIPFVSD